MTATLKAVTDLDGGESRTWTDLPFGDTQLPSQSFLGIVDEVAAFAIGRPTSAQEVTAEFDESSFTFPGSWDALLERAGSSPVYAAGYLQLLGMLHPKGEFNEVRDRLFERSLVELERLSPETPFYRYFKARAFAYLDRRPAAVALLTGTLNRHEEALLAALNGNLPELQERVAGDETSVLRFMALKDLQVIERWYKGTVGTDALEPFVEAHPAWAAMVSRSMRDYAPWADYSIATLKLALDSLTATSTLSLEEFFEKEAVVGNLPDDVELTRLVWEHIGVLEEERNSGGPRAGQALFKTDIGEWAKTTAVSNHLRAVGVDLESRALPDKALDKLNRFESFYAGHPEVTLLKARVLREVMKDSTATENTNLRQAAKTARANGFAWTGRLTQDAVAVARSVSDAFNLRPRMSLNESPFVRYSTRYTEWPRSSAWYYFIRPEEREDGAFQRCIDYMWTAFQCVMWTIQVESESHDNPEQLRAELLAKYSDRFHGHPKRDEFAVRIARESGDADAEMRELRSKVDAGSTDWSLYYALGIFHKRRGEYDKAQEAWLAYPGFGPDGSVEATSVENQADLAAAMLYWIGQHELARPLLELSASSNAGSGASMSSSQRLALLNGDLELAAQWAAARVRRYDSPYGFRDFLQLLHAFGESPLAWNTFDQYQAVRQDVQMWSGALVGHRIESATSEAIAEWLHSSDARISARARASRRGETIDLAPRYLLMAGTMDRIPDDKFADLVSKAFSSPRPIYHHRTTHPSPLNELSEPVEYTVVRDGRYEFAHDPLVPFPQEVHRLADRQEIDHRYTMLARAMTSFLGEDHAAAFKQFNETAYFYYLEEYLPYYAFSAATVGQSKHIEELLRGREQEFEKVLQKEKLLSSSMGYRFDEDLTYAVLSAFSADHESSIRYLRQALNNRPYLDDRSVYPMYQIVELAVRLYEQTGEHVYREFALDQSRRHAVVLPMYAWPYFVVAKYSDNSFERTRATASGLHLDPLSNRAKSIDKQLLDDARRLLETNGPPYLNSEGTKEVQET
ncbi:MAG: hypothetical protein OEZ11_14640 [Gammaproteobacteria bacterium]|nr:hypothetical protein [Gammaproteobacteria bacterium]